MTTLWLTKIKRKKFVKNTDGSWNYINLLPKTFKNAQVKENGKCCLCDKGRLVGAINNDDTWRRGKKRCYGHWHDILPKNLT